MGVNAYKCVLQVLSILLCQFAVFYKQIIMSYFHTHIYPE